MFVLPRQYKILTVGAVQNNYNLFVQAGSPNNAITVLNFLNANCQTGNSTPAYDTGSGWRGGSYLFIQNAAKINGSPGGSGSVGAGGAGGKGGAGGIAGALGGAGVAGSTGTSGTSGSQGVTAFNVSPATNSLIYVNNTDTFNGGPGGPGGSGGGGGGGGGGG